MTNNQFGKLITIPGIAIIVGIIFYPTIYNFYISFLHFDNILPVQFVGFRNYKWLFTSPDFYNSWKVSALYAGGGTLLSLIMAIFVAHSLNHIIHGRALFRTLVMIPWVVPLVIIGFMWKWMFSKDQGIINYVLVSLGIVEESIGFLSDPKLALFAGIVSISFRQIPFITVLLIAGLESIPRELYEVAKVDGADSFHMFRHISIPLNRHQIVMASLLTLMFTFRTPDIFLSLTRGGPAKSTYHAGIFLFDTIFQFGRFDRAGTIGVVMLLTILLYALPILYFGIVRRR
jgi:multiple sugar transport system permease protein